jgi:hypothetical protein
MTNIDHIMPNPKVILILWGRDYATNQVLADNIKRMLSDLVTGPFMNGLAQYGVARGQMIDAIIIDDNNPPQKLVYFDTSNKLVDEITKKLISWILAKQVPAPTSDNDINLMYMIIPPPQTTPQTYNRSDDPIGNGVQGWHNEGNTNPPGPPTYYWAIVKTNDVGSSSDITNFTNGIGPKVSHELAEQFSDRNGLFTDTNGNNVEIGDGCNNINNFYNYRSWQIEQYFSVWDNTCINGDRPISLKKFLAAINFDFHNNGLRQLNTDVINIGYIATTMRSH